MTESTLKLHYAFGTRCMACPRVQYINEEVVLYSLGRRLGLYNTSNRMQAFLPDVTESLNASLENISDFCISPSPHKYVAIADTLSSPESQGRISIYHIATQKKQQTILIPSSTPLTSISFSSDGQHIAALSSGNPSAFFVWQWPKAQLIGKGISNDVLKTLAFIPDDNNFTLSSSCAESFHLWRLLPIESLYKPVNITGITKSMQGFAAHAWSADGKCFALTKENKLFWVQNGKLMEVLSLPWQCSGHFVSVSTVMNHGIFIGTSTGELAYFGREPNAMASLTDSKDTDCLTEHLQLRQSFQLNFRDALLAIHSTGQHVVCAAASNIIAYASLVHTSEAIPTQLPFTYLGIHAHRGPIMAIGTCTLPIIATVALDRYFCLWSLSSRRCELAFPLAYEPCDVALHPLGHWTIIAFQSSPASLFAIQMDSLVLAHTFPYRTVHGVAFSSNGQWIALFGESTMYVINAVTLDLHWQSTAHLSKIVTVQFLQNDTLLSSTGADGAIYIWHLYSTKRVNELVIKANDYTSTVLHAPLPDSLETMNTFHSDMYRVLGTCADKSVQYRPFENTPESLIESPPSEVILSSDRCTSVLLLNEGQTGCLGTVNGNLLVIPSFPKKSGNSKKILSMNPSISLPLHDGTLTCLRNSYWASKVCFSAGHDGILFVYELTSSTITPSGKQPFTLSSLQPVDAPSSSYTPAWLESMVPSNLRKFLLSEAFLYTRAAYNKRLDELKQKQAELKEIEKEMQYKSQMASQKLEMSTRTLTEKFTKEIQELKETNASLEAEKKKQAEEHEIRVKQLSIEHMNTVDDMESSYEKKLSAAHAKCQAIGESMVDEQCRQEESKVAVQVDMEKQLSKQEKEHQSKLSSLKGEYDALTTALETQALGYEETLRQTQAHHEQEVDSLKSEHASEVAKLQEQVANLKIEHTLAQQDFAMGKSEVESCRRQAKTMEDELQSVNQQLAESETEIRALAMGNAEQVKTTEERDLRLAEVKTRNKELEKIKYVLDYKLQLLKGQLLPKDQRIQGMEKTIQELDNELRRTMHATEELKLVNHEKQQHIKQLQGEMKEKSRMVTDIYHLLENMERTLQVCVKSTELKTLRSHVMSLLQVITQTLDQGTIRQSSGQKESDMKQKKALDEEFVKQQSWMEKKVGLVEKRAHVTLNQYQRELTRKSEENEALLREVNELRKQIHEIQSAGKRIVPPKQSSNTSTKRLTPFQQRQPSRPGSKRQPSDAVRIATLDCELTQSREQIQQLRKEIQELKLQKRC